MSKTSENLIKNERQLLDNLQSKVRYLELEEDFFGLCKMWSETNDASIIKSVDEAIYKVYLHNYISLWDVAYGVGNLGMMTKDIDFIREGIFMMELLSMVGYEHLHGVVPSNIDEYINMEYQLRSQQVEIFYKNKKNN